MKQLLKALAEVLADQAEDALADHGTSLQAIDRDELLSQFGAQLEARST